MKKILILLCCFVLVSCTEPSMPDFLGRDASYFAELSEGDITLSGRLGVSDEVLTFTLDSPESLKIILSRNGGAVEYKGMVFDTGESEMTRLNGLYRAILDGSAEIKYENSSPVSIDFGGVVLKLREIL